MTFSEMASHPLHFPECNGLLTPLDILSNIFDILKYNKYPFMSDGVNTSFGVAVSQ